MITEWRGCTLGDVIELQRGYDITKNEQRNGIIPVISSGGLSSYHDAAMVDGPGVVMGRKGTLGRIFYTENPFWPHDTTLWVRDFKSNYPRFVYYFLHTLDFEHMNVGSANPTLNRNHVHPLPVRWPPLAVQREIAGVLGALDGKIATNDEVIASVDTLFHLEWRKFYASNEGWSRAVLGDIAPTQYGLTASAQQGAEGPYFLRVTDINKDNWIDWGSVPAVSCEKSDFSKYNLERGDLLVARMGDPGKSAIYEGSSRPAVFASYLVRLKPPSFDHGLYLYGFLKSDHFSMYADSVITGTVQKNMNAKLIGAAPLSVPPGEEIVKFARKTSLLRDRIASGLHENIRLAATRDELLPLLMSGKITVKDAEKTVEEVV